MRGRKVKYLDSRPENWGKLMEGWIVRETPIMYYYINPIDSWKQQDVVRVLKHQVIILEET